MEKSKHIEETKEREEGSCDSYREEIPLDGPKD